MWPVIVCCVSAEMYAVYIWYVYSLHAMYMWHVFCACTYGVHGVCIWLACSVYILFSVLCTWCVQGNYVLCTWCVNGICVLCRWYVCGLCVVCLWCVRGVFCKSYIWAFQGHILLKSFFKGLMQYEYGFTTANKSLKPNSGGN